MNKQEFIKQEDIMTNDSLSINGIQNKDWFNSIVSKQVSKDFAQTVKYVPASVLEAYELGELSLDALQFLVYSEVWNEKKGKKICRIIINKILGHRKVTAAVAELTEAGWMKIHCGRRTQVGFNRWIVESDRYEMTDNFKIRFGYKVKFNEFVPGKVAVYSPGSYKEQKIFNKNYSFWRSKVEHDRRSDIKNTISRHNAEKVWNIFKSDFIERNHNVSKNGKFCFSVEKTGRFHCPVSQFDDETIAEIIKPEYDVFSWDMKSCHANLLWNMVKLEAVDFPTLYSEAVGIDRKKAKKEFNMFLNHKTMNNCAMVEWMRNNGYSEYVTAVIGAKISVMEQTGESLYDLLAREEQKIMSEIIFRLASENVFFVDKHDGLLVDSRKQNKFNQIISALVESGVIPSGVLPEEINKEEEDKVDRTTETGTSWLYDALFLKEYKPKKKTDFNSEDDPVYEFLDPLEDEKYDYRDKENDNSHDKNCSCRVCVALNW